MKSLRLTAVAAALTFAALAGAGPADAAAQTPADILQAGAQKGVSDGYPAVVGLVRQGDTSQYAHAGFGNLSTRVAADPKAQYRIGSNTKAFTSAVLLQLESEQRLSLDDSVARWLPGAVNANGYDGTRITVRELLNQTSGLPEYFSSPQVSTPYVLDLDPSRPWPPQTLVDIALSTRRPDAAPGEKFAYANTNYVLAGMVIKAVTGNEAATEIQHRIIEPLGLQNTTFPLTDPNLHGNYLHGYMYPTIGFGIRDVTSSDVQVFGSAGSIVSNLDDLATFTRALLDGRLLPPAQLAELKTTVPASSDGTIRYGLGITHQQQPCGQWAWGHNGAVLGYFTGWMASDDGSRQVVIANTEYHLAGGTQGQTDTATAAVNAFCAL